MKAAADQFTLARVATVLGRDAREIRRTMAGREPDGTVIIGGNPARTYLVSSLPAGLQQELSALAERRGYDSSERLLGRQETRWEPTLRPVEIHPNEVECARKRAIALATWVQAYSVGERPLEEVKDGAAAAHQRGLGYSVTPETLDILMRRVIRRDGGRAEFARWELYLPENPKRRAPAQTGAGADDFAHFNGYLAGLNTSAPSVEDRAWAWTAMCENLQELIEHGSALRETRRRLVRHVFGCAPWLSSSRDSLAKCFDEKWRRYCAGERFLTDRRPQKSGNHSALPLLAEDKDKLTARALAGGLSKAWRDSMQAADLNGGAVERYLANPASKSYVPRRVRQLIAPDVKMLQDIHHGPRQAKLKGAYITRDWSSVAPGDWYQADDTTLPLYYYEENEAGGFHALRGQCLVMTDLSANRVLALALHSERNYTATVIRGLILKTHDGYGLPRRGFYFENGLWRKSKLLKGSAAEIPGDETERGLRDFGVTFKHAKPGNARAKPVERIIGLLQTRMEDQPGYVGRNEQTEKFERVQRKLVQARAGKIEFASFLLHRDEWLARLTEICDAYNSERQDGRLKGLSPREAWESRFDFEKPLVRLTDGARYLLANHRRPYKVTRNGIRIQLGKEAYWFRSEATGRLIGRIVQVFFNPDDMSSVWLRSEGNNAEPLVVPRALSEPAMDATREEQAAAARSCDDQNRPARTLYVQIATHFPKNGPSPFRRNVIAGQFAETTRDLQEQQEQIRARQTEDAKQDRKAASVRRLLGNQPGSEAISNTRLLAAQRLLNDAELKR